MHKVGCLSSQPRLCSFQEYARRHLLAVSPLSILSESLCVQSLLLYTLTVTCQATGKMAEINVFEQAFQSTHVATESQLPVSSQSTPYSLMNDLQFLDVFPEGNASLIIILPDGDTSIITGLDVDIISQKCPLLAYSFEDRAYGLSQASIEASSRGLVVHFLQFLYLGDYNDQGGFGSEPCSLLRHAELLRMGEIFEVPELQTLARTSILQDTEASCSRPSPPDDLCSAISFIYAQLSDQRSLIESILHYCVFCFLYHKLGKNPAFRQLAFELRPFSNDLIRTSYFRDFEDEGKQ